MKVTTDLLARALTSIFQRHSYTPTTIICDLGTAFTSELMSELADLMELQPKHCTLKHAQTKGLLEKNHAPFKQILRINENQSTTDWHRYLDIAFYIHNTTYAPALGCTRSDVFHGRTPVNPPDLRLHNTNLWEKNPKRDSVKKLQDKTTELFDSVKENLMASYLKHKYYDRKTNATPIKIHQHCLILNHIGTTQVAIMNE